MFQTLLNVRARIGGGRSLLGDKPFGPVLLLLTAFFVSGFASIVSQTVWQRALKVYVAGSEALSSLIVVLVFMLGLGLGSWLAGVFARRIANPLRVLWMIEFTLAAFNVAVGWMLGRDIADSIHAFQRMALSFGVPLRLLYACFAGAMLLGPCLLMGTTMAMAGEASQRQLGLTKNGFIPLLFAINTFGAACGALVAGFFLLPYAGQAAGLSVAAQSNAIAGFMLLWIWLKKPKSAALIEIPAPNTARLLQIEEVLGFFLGFFSLAYEMYVFRIIALSHEPLPYHFASVLCTYLLFWAAGVFLAGRIRERVQLLLMLTGAVVALMPIVFLMARWMFSAEVFGYQKAVILYCLPCILFGMLFGQLTMRYAQKNWGSDVGRYYGLNTFGSCLGIVAVTFIGFEFDHIYIAWTLAFCYLALAALWSYRVPETSSFKGRGLVFGGLVAVTCASVMMVAQPQRWLAFTGVPAQVRSYFSKDGVIEIVADHHLLWDGLWHSALSDGKSHVGSNNWLLGVVPVLCHSGESSSQALVIGLGTGITAGTLSKSSRVGGIDVYDINEKLKVVMEDYPQGTLGVARDPKINIWWRDGRSGVALNDKQYDLITQQPLYLKQAGSSVLLSKEYFRLIQRRLKKNGIFVVYCNSMGNEAQARVVRQTVTEVFAYYVSFGKGFMIAASNEPIEYTSASLEKKLSGPDALMEEARGGSLAQSVARFMAYRDVPPLSWVATYPVTDDFPIVEYPEAAASLADSTK